MIAWVRRLLASSERLLRIAAVLTIVALGMMVWSMVVPTVWPVMVAMSIGQGLGTTAFVMYLVVVARDLRGRRKDDE